MTSNGRRRRVGGADPRGKRRDVRRGEAVARRDDPAAVPPGDVDVEAVGPELDRRARVVEPDVRVADVVRGDRDDRREQRRVAGTATLFAAQTSRSWRSRPGRRARGRSPNIASLRDDRLRFTTGAPCVDRPVEAGREREALAPVVGPEDADRHDVGAPGARAWTIPAQAVPWPTTSIALGRRRRSCPRRRARPGRSATSAPPTAGWLALDARVDDRDGDPGAVRRRRTPSGPVAAAPSGARCAARPGRGVGARTARSRPAGGPSSDGGSAGGRPAATARPARSARERGQRAVPDEVELSRIGRRGAGRSASASAHSGSSSSASRPRDRVRDDRVDVASSAVGGRRRRASGAATARTQRGVAVSRSTRLAPDRDRRLPGEDRGELEVAQVERRLAALVEDLEDADGALVVDERHRDQRARHVAGLLGERAAEARRRAATSDSASGWPVVNT